MAKLPNRWGPGTIFALSGYQHETSYSEPFLAAPETETLGLLFRHPAAGTLRFGELTPAAIDEAKSVCSNELLDLTLLGGGRILLVHADRDTLVGRVWGGALPHLSDDAAALSLSLAEPDADASRRFAVGFAATDPARASARAKAGLAAEVETLAAERRAWLEALPLPAGLDEGSERCFRKACAILAVNVESAQGVVPCRWTTPDRFPHRHMWLWDSAFHAIGWRRLDPRMAEEAILAKLSRLREDDFLTLMSAPDPAVGLDDCTQPPVLAWAAERVHDLSGNDEFLREAYDPLKRYLRWDMEHRKSPVEGLYGWRIATGQDHVREARGGESGWDNNPRFDGISAMAAIDLSCQIQHELAALGRIAGRLGNSYEANGCRAAAAQLARVINEKMYDPTAGFYFDLDQHGQPIRVKTAASFTPLWSEAASKEQSRRLVEQLTRERSFWRALPVPSVAADQDAYSDDMWRGPTWLNYNYLIYEGLRKYKFDREAGELRRRILAEVTRWYREDGTIYEYYDAEAERSPSQLHRKGRVGYDGWVGVIRDYHFSAAVFVELMSEQGSSR